MLIFGSDKLLVSNSFIFLFWTCSQIVCSGRQGHGCSALAAHGADAVIDKGKVVPVAGASVDREPQKIARYVPTSRKVYVKNEILSVDWGWL